MVLKWENTTTILLEDLLGFLERKPPWTAAAGGMDVTIVADTLGNAVCSQDQGHMIKTELKTYRHASHGTSLSQRKADHTCSAFGRPRRTYES